MQIICIQFKKFLLIPPQLFIRCVHIWDVFLHMSENQRLDISELLQTVSQAELISLLRLRQIIERIFYR